MPSRRTGRPPVRFAIRGLKPLDRALGKADRNLRTNLRAGLKDVAAQVATEARDIVSSKGLVKTGDLRAGIKPYALSGRAGVRSTAVHRGFAYPLRLEFQGRDGNRYGPRASLYPALEAKQDVIDRGIEHVLDNLGRDFTS